MEGIQIMAKIIATLAILIGLIANTSAMGKNNSTIPPISTPKKYDATYSVCGPAVPTDHIDFSIANYVSPTTPVYGYLIAHGIIVEPDTPHKIVLVVRPHHGELRTEGDSAYVYFPNEGYLGPDQMTFVVEVQNKKFKVIETVWVSRAAPEYGGCPDDYKLPLADEAIAPNSKMDRLSFLTKQFDLIRGEFQ